MFMRYFHTIRYLRPIQVYGRILFRLRSPKVRNHNALPVRQMKRAYIQPIIKQQSLLAPYRFRLLNEIHEINNATDWDNPHWSKLWRYNLHYFDDLNAKSADERLEWHQSLIRRWISENPMGHGSGWEPYPCSLRIVNWVKWLLRGNEPSSEMLKNLSVQARWLAQRLEYHILGNHLLANAKALIHAGLFFQGNEAREWFTLGHRIFKEQLAEQILPDGGHFELSPMYHCIVLEDLLDIMNLYQAYGISVPTLWTSTAISMLEWLFTMIHPDGDIPFFNDAAFDIASPANELKHYAQQLNIVFKESMRPIEDLSDSGYIRINRDQATVFLDVGNVGPDYLPGHAHADTLSFELSLNGDRVFVNSGVSQYGEDAERQRQRGTAAHNTVMVDNENSSEVWGGFRVARRARPIQKKIRVNSSSIEVHAAHDGYKRLSGRPVHQRTWKISQNSLVLLDQITGSGRHIACSYLHIHPRYAVRINDRDQILVECENGALKCIIEFLDDGKTLLHNVTYHPKFGVSVPCIRIAREVEGKLPLMLQAKISWAKSEME